MMMMLTMMMSVFDVFWR